MKTSTLCTGCLSLVLLAAGISGLADASAGPRGDGERAWSPLAAVSDSLAAWMTPGGAASESSAWPVGRPHEPREIAARPVSPTSAAAPTADEPSPPACVLAGDAVIVLPDWDCEGWQTLNAESPRVSPTPQLQMKNLIERSLRSHPIRVRAPEFRKRA